MALLAGHTDRSTLVTAARQFLASNLLCVCPLMLGLGLKAKIVGLSLGFELETRPGCVICDFRQRWSSAEDSKPPSVVHMKSNDSQTLVRLF